MLFRSLLQTLFFVAATFGVISIPFPTAHAQSLRVTTPNENELNRQGLTMSWWGQAAVRSSQERVTFFTADEQNVYVQSTSGVLTSFQGESGRRLWAQLIGSPNQHGFAATSGDDDVLIALGMKVYAFNKVSGVPRWELTLPSPPSTSPKEDERFLYVGTVDGMMRAYDVQKIRSLAKKAMLPQWTNRAELWTYKMMAPSNSTPIPVENDVVFASERGNIYRKTGEPNKLLFNIEMKVPLSAPITYSRDYVFAADVRSRLSCNSIHDGSPLWTFSSGAPVRMQPRVVGKQIFVAPLNAGLFALNITTGLILWKQPLATDVVAVTDTRVYASDPNKNLLILDRNSGKLLGQLRMTEFSVRVHNDRTDRIYLATPGGTVVALREMTSEFPLYHLYPERRPILPMFAPEDGEEEEAKPKTDEAAES
ncbi:MAG TPA: PQQ-binding-like beta-propeller repeat protein [Planctomicrobium sp.]|nr:PQQ-binding-like beta-propeller repeat protein [Planctomicrobium sp.]